MNKLIFTLLVLSVLPFSDLNAQRSIARDWNEAILESMREDLARPPVNARTLFHTSIAMYDAWAAFDTIARPYVLGRTVYGVNYPFNGIAKPQDIKAARKEAIFYATYRVALHRFADSPNYPSTFYRFYNLMIQNGYNVNFVSTDYSTGSPAALGNLIGQYIIAMGYNDGSNELNNYASLNYTPSNLPLEVNLPGNPNMTAPNRWQPLIIVGALDQNGNPIPALQKFQSPEWGRVQPFALKQIDKTIYTRNGFEYPVYHDPGPQLMLHPNTPTDSISTAFKWNHSLVSIWSAHHTTSDGVNWDISPATQGNIPAYPQTTADYPSFYKLEGGDNGIGHTINPKTGQPYTPQMVPRGDYTRVISQFWADGPRSETPPGHWFTILNYVQDQPGLVLKFGGQGAVLDTLEWDVKAYFTLGGAMHDAAISAWGIKGWYDGSRPVSALRYMAGKGQSTNASLPSYHPEGLELVPGYVELVMMGDPLAGVSNEHVGKIKLYTWRGAAFTNGGSTEAGAGWILAEKWSTYQRSTFVTPPFGGYISGHSTYSRAAAEVLTDITGDPYFPGGMGEYVIPANNGFLGFEPGPSVEVRIQWATYRDASDQTSLSRIWGGIHPPYDDIPGRTIGALCAQDAFNLARAHFNNESSNDNDNDGYFAYEDCDDNNPNINPKAVEICDRIDNDCNGLIDDNIPVFSYYSDNDADGFGNIAARLDTCLATAPIGYVTNADDCDDTRATIRPGATEVCDGLDNDCNGLTDDNANVFAFYQDLDHDGFGNPNVRIDTCLIDTPANFVLNPLDCDDTNATVYLDAPEICDALDNNCNGTIDEGLATYTYYVDADADGFGDSSQPLVSCNTTTPAGTALLDTDCDDKDNSIFPGALEVPDGKDNNCDGIVDNVSSVDDIAAHYLRLSPNPVHQRLVLSHRINGDIYLTIRDMSGKTILTQSMNGGGGQSIVDCSLLLPGVYLVHIISIENGASLFGKFIKQ